MNLQIIYILAGGMNMFYAKPSLHKTLCDNEDTVPKTAYPKLIHLA